MVNRSLLILVLFFLSFELFSLEKNGSGDTVIYSSEKIGLIILTQNIDSIKYYQERNKQIQPFSPTMESFSARISTYDTASLTISVKDVYENNLTTFIWTSISPGAYRFDWWQYINDLPSGVYYIEKIINNNSETYKALIVK